MLLPLPPVVWIDGTRSRAFHSKLILLQSFLLLIDKVHETDRMFRALLREQKKIVPAVISTARREFAAQAEHTGRVRVFQNVFFHVL